MTGSLGHGGRHLLAKSGTEQCCLNLQDKHNPLDLRSCATLEQTPFICWKQELFAFCLCCSSALYLITILFSVGLIRSYFKLAFCLATEICQPIYIKKKKKVSKKVKVILAAPVSIRLRVRLCRFNKPFRICSAALPASRSTPTRPLPLEQPSRAASWLVMSLMCCCWMSRRCLWVLRPWVESSPNSSTETPPFPPRRARYLHDKHHIGPLS